MSKEFTDALIAAEMKLGWGDRQAFFAAGWEAHVEAMKRIAAAPVAQGLDVDAVMTKIQEFASTWAVVGGRFDDGTAMECAEECKAEIRAILAKSASASAQQAEPVAWLFDNKEDGKHWYDTPQPMGRPVYAAPAPASPAALTDRAREILSGNLECLEFCADVVRSMGHDSMAEGLLAVHYAINTLAASPADQMEDARGKTWALFELRRLPAVTINEIDGEESDGTPKTWRRPYVSRRKVEELLDAIYADRAAMSATPPAAEGKA